MSGKIFADKVYTCGEILKNRLISFEDGLITAVELAVPVDNVKHVPNLAAGFADIHINGGEQYHFTANPTVEAVEDIDVACRKYGTAWSLPALITSPIDTIMRGIDAVRSYREKEPSSGILGIHLEGPFISVAKRGAHLPEYIRKPNTADLEEIISYGRGVIKMITVAPEEFTAEQLEMLLASGITVSSGHSNATCAEASAAFGAGIRLVTHLYNAMSPLNHREPGLVGAAFDNPDVYTPLIPDGHHSSFTAARIAYKIKKDKLFLISDALFAGRKVDTFKWGAFDARLQDDQYINSEGNLAGAAISLGEGVKNAVEKIGIPLTEAIEMVTSRPAKVLGLGGTIGKVEAGYPAVFTVFDDSLETFGVLKV